MIYKNKCCKSKVINQQDKIKKIGTIKKQRSGSVAFYYF